LFVRCFVEVGCQARNFPDQPEDWFYSPAIHLMQLYDDEQEPDLRLVIEAGLLLVVAAIVSRRDPAEDREAAAQELGRLFRLHPASEAVKRASRPQRSRVARPPQKRAVQELAVTALLWPEGRPLARLDALAAIHDGLRKGIAT
jgi:hypothetical protein